MTTRIRLNGGHAELSIGGVKYRPDELGAFTVPDENVRDLLHMHGGEIQPGLEQMYERLETAKTALVFAEGQVEQAKASVEALEATILKMEDDKEKALKARLVAVTEKSSADKAKNSGTLGVGKK